MRIILSRKGMDSAAGGIPSPILPDGTMLSLPIPESNSVTDADTTYDDIEYDNISYSEIIHDLTEGKKRKGKPFTIPGCTKCHVDPDLTNRYTKPVAGQGWNAAFGQHGKWQKHLKDYDIKEGDLFLFYGWFRPTQLDNGKLKYIKEGKMAKQGKHIIWGYMQIGGIIPKEDIPDKFPYHPHSKHGEDMLMNEEHNVLYVPKKNGRLTLDHRKPAYGIMKYDCDKSFEERHDLDLTKEDCSLSKWRLPNDLKNVEITCHTNGFKNGYFQSAYRGQEFIINTDVIPGTEYYSWLEKILSHVKE